jgi:hypothetical protein
MNAYSENYEKEISLVELLFYCLKKWRWIVCSMIVIAAAAGGYKYLSTVKSNQIQQEAQALLEENGETEPVEVVENPRVRYYEQAIASNELELEQQEAYLKDSVVMQMDAYHLWAGTLSFYMDVPDEQDGNSLNNLFAAYKAYVTDGRLARQLFDADNSIPIVDLGYLLSFNKGKETIEILLNNGGKSTNEAGNGLNIESEQNVFQIQVIASSEELAIAYTEKIEESVMGYSRELAGDVAVHDLKLLAAVQTEKMDNDMASYQSSVLSSYGVLLNSLKTLKTDLKAIRDEEGDTITLGQTFSLANPVSAAVKYGIVGLVLGAFLAGFVLILVYLMSGKLQSTEMFREEFGMQLLGEVKAPVGKKKLFGFIDNWLYHLEEGAYANIPREEQMRIAAASLKGAVNQKEGLKKIMLAGTIAKEDVEEFCGCLKEHVQEAEFSSYKQIVFDAAALEELSDYDAVVFLERKRVSYSKLIKKEREMVSGREIPVLGTIVV